MTIFKTINYLSIFGSISKFLQGENITPLNREKIKQGIKMLKSYTGFDLSDAVVCSVEFGTSLITKEKPFRYLSLFGYNKIPTKVEHSKNYETETVTYTSKTGAFEFIAYDKIKEMLSKKQDIPLIFYDSNVLRLEYRIRKRRGLEAKFKKDLSAYDLFDEEVYLYFHNLFLETYSDIEKMGRLIYVDKSKKLTPAKIRELQAEQYRQSFQKEYQFFIQQAKETGQLSPRNLERIRASDRKYNRNVYISDQSTLIKELDALVYDRMMFST